MNYDRNWLGPTFDESESLSAEVDANGQVVGFGLKSAEKSITVRIEPPCVTTIEHNPEDVLPEDWLERWRDELIDQTRPKSFQPTCGFCGKTDKEVRKIIAGPSVMICNECVELCSEILSQE